MRAPVLAAGGIVLRQARSPLIAVVRLRKGNEWVLPKGKLDDGETPRDAAMREVLEETGHDVSVHEFLGTLAYDLGGRSKIVHYWRMESCGKPTRDLMHDVSAVDWLPLRDAVERLSRDHERAFLANVGPLALEAARRSRERKPVATDKRRRATSPKSSPATSSPALSPAASEMAPAGECGSPLLRASVSPVELEMDISPAEAACSEVMLASEHQGTVEARQALRIEGLRIDWMRKLRNWLRQAV